MKYYSYWLSSFLSKHFTSVYPVFDSQTCKAFILHWGLGSPRAEAYWEVTPPAVQESIERSRREGRWYQCHESCSENFHFLLIPWFSLNIIHRVSEVLVLSFYHLTKPLNLRFLQVFHGTPMIIKWWSCELWFAIELIVSATWFCSIDCQWGNSFLYPVL